MMGGQEEQPGVVEEATVEKVLKRSSSVVSEKEVTLKDLARSMANFAAEREWDQFHSPRNLLLALVITSPLSMSQHFFGIFQFHNQNKYLYTFWSRLRSP